MQRQSTRINVTIIFKYNRGTHESGTCEFESMVTPEEFTSNYSELCALKTEFIDRKSACFPAPYYSIELSGTRNNLPFKKAFTNLDDYHFFLTRHNLWSPPPANKHRVL